MEIIENPDIGPALFIWVFVLLVKVLVFGRRSFRFALSKFTESSVDLMGIAQSLAIVAAYKHKLEANSWPNWMLAFFCLPTLMAVYALVHISLSPPITTGRAGIAPPPPPGGGEPPPGAAAVPAYTVAILALFFFSRKVAA